MYIEKPEDAKTLSLLLRRKLRGISGVEVFVAPPLTMLTKISEIFESAPIRVGAQTISAHANGAHTGEVSGPMLKSAGASFVIVGHSERRSGGDTEEIVRQQLELAIEAGLTPILCVGEESRRKEGVPDDGARDHFSFVEEQLSSALKNVPKNVLKKLIIAYEPVWAIGKSATEAMKPGELQEMVIFIRRMLAELVDREAALRIPILYGGSVEPENAASLIQEGGVAGFLVGHASAQADSFLAIIDAVRLSSR